MVVIVVHTIQMTKSIKIAKANKMIKILAILIIVFFTGVLLGAIAIVGYGNQITDVYNHA
jgi:hypothetical protein